MQYATTAKTMEILTVRNASLHYRMNSSILKPKFLMGASTMSDHLSNPQ